MATHSNARALCDHPRNLTDDQLRALAERGGMAGMNFYPGFVKPDHPTIEDILDHVEYIANLIGPSHVGLGPDYINMAPAAVEASLIRADPTGTIYAGSHVFPQGAEDISSFFAVADRLRHREWAEADIVNVMGGNFMRIFQGAGM
jgi:membrane dipeptidase